MVTSKAKTVDEYLATLDSERRAGLEAFRRLVKRAAKTAEETMQYGMPTYLLGGPWISFNAQKKYLAFYVCDEAVIRRYRSRLGGLDCGKSCERGKRGQDFPLQVLAQIAAESAARRRDALARGIDPSATAKAAQHRPAARARRGATPRGARR